MKFFKKNKKNKITAIFLHDGYCWYGSVYKDDGVVSKIFDISDSEKLAPELLQWALEQNAKQVKVALLADLHNINMELPDGLDMEQTHTAIAWETAELTGRNAMGVRHASCKISSFGIENSSGELITASFKTSLLKDFNSQCNAYRLEFLGVASIQSAFLSLHLKDEKRKNKNLVLLLDTGVFAFISNTGRGSKTQMRNILFELDKNNLNALFKNRFKVKLQHLQLNENNFCVYEFNLKKSQDGDVLPKDANLTLIEEIFFSEFPKNNNDFLQFPEVVEPLMRIVKESKTGDLNCSCPLAALPEVKLGKSGKANLISLLLVVCALIYVVFYSTGLFIRNMNLRYSYLQMKSFIVKRDAIEGKLNKIRKEVDRKKELYTLMNGGKEANKRFFDFLNALASVIPGDMVLGSIQFDENSIKILGEVDAQVAFSKFCNDVNSEVKDLKFTILSSSLKKNSVGTKSFEISFGVIDD